MSNQKFADFLILENKINVLERSNLFQRTYEKVKSFNNFFSSSLNLPELDYKPIFEKFTEDHQEMLDFIKRNNWEKINFKTFFEKSKKERVLNKDIFAEFAVFLDCEKFLKNPYTCLKKFFCLDSSSSGIQISGLLINSQQLLTFSNVLGNEKSDGYKKMRSDLFDKFLFLLENFNFEFFSYNEKTFDFFSDLSKNYFLIAYFNLRELVFIAYFIRESKNLFYSFFDIETIKTAVIGQIYGMTRAGIEEKVEELLINSFNKKVISEIEEDFLLNEKSFSLLKKTDGPINEVSKILEDLKKNQERFKKKQTSIKNLKITLKRKIKFYENLNKAKKEGDKIKPIKLKAVLTKLYLNLIRKSKISDNFTRIKPIFQSMVSIHKLSQQTNPFIAENENFKFSLEYPPEVSHRINIKTYKYEEEKQFFKLGKRRQITIKKKGEGFDYKKLKLAISANFIQNIDSEILNNFVDICKNLSLPVYICHDKFGLPYMFNFFLRPIVSEAMLKISWEQKLLSFCRENGLKEIETKTISTSNDFLLFYLHLKIKFLIYPKIFASLFKDVKKNKKVISSNVLSSTELLENFQKEAKRLDLKIRDVNYNLRNNFTNPFFIKK